MDRNSKIYVAGHQGLVGSAIVRKLKAEGYQNIIVRTHSELDLIDQTAVTKFFDDQKPEYIFLAAAKVGGIYANSNYPADFAYENLMIECNVLYNAYRFKAHKLLFLGSSCIYPKNCIQPIKEEYLLSSYLEPTNEAYALAKISGLKMCQYFNEQYGTNFISVMPTNLYGPNDNFGLENSHVLPALIRRIHEAKQNNVPTVEIWGTGKPLREFLYVDDLADACIFLMNNYSGNDFFNVGTGRDITISDLADKIKQVVGYEGNLVFNKNKPDGMYQKLLDVSKIANLGWRHKISLDEGLKLTYSWYLANMKRLRAF